MIREASQLSAIIEICEEESAKTFLIYKPTYDLIIKALEFARASTEEEIRKRVLVCEGKRESGLSILRNQWQVIIDSLKWVIFECELDPLESRRQLIPFAK